MAKKVIFAEVTPLGDRVLLTRDRWREIIRYKHPALANHEDEVRACVRDPDFVRASAKDQDTHFSITERSTWATCAWFSEATILSNAS